MRQMKAYSEAIAFGAMTIEDLGITQGQGQKCKIFTI